MAALTETGIVTEACKAAFVTRDNAYHARDRDDRFKAAWEQAVTTSVDALELEARRRAVDGSDTLLMFLLNGNRPEKYRHRQDVSHSGDLIIRRYEGVDPGVV